MKGKKRKPTGARATRDVKYGNAERKNKKKKPVQNQQQVGAKERQGEETINDTSNTEAEDKIGLVFQCTNWRVAALWDLNHLLLASKYTLRNSSTMTNWNDETNEAKSKEKKKAGAKHLKKIQRVSKAVDNFSEGGKAAATKFKRK
ncbi:hypothetical protein CHS0354_005812 [Potamilus streckersoni]|uniref:Uncharacterized protein n=1 Tax=Potamilus streckersoni TaxID=2493646 RepID=A0AAE0W2C3_9BIVA|nr:hypothetical protein CHS0354_005812 [Potamilus streckersoni]